ncbi:MAG: cytochrome P460 family protein [Candidatus Thiodiazotropha sp. (ex Dulcina madagascariensis)]|nr:cytochrome P460 family protein [Candidatus Thiodiazotropha sp. (ex Dulcina madagascariensis)]
MRIVYFFRYFLSVLGLAVAMVLSVHAADSFSPNVDSEGNVSLPDDFRRNMVHLGSWFVPEGGASGFHDVYTEAETVDTYRRTGQFPDGATLVKELRAANSADYTTGKDVSHATAAVKQWFVMVKDTKDRFGNNPVWGDGWGWALFKTDQPKRNVATDYKSDCLGCHTPVKAKDWVYVEGYPTLNKP